MKRQIKVAFLFLRTQRLVSSGAPQASGVSFGVIRGSGTSIRGVLSGGATMTPVEQQAGRTYTGALGKGEAVGVFFLLTFDRSQAYSYRNSIRRDDKEASCRELIYCAAPWTC